MSKKLPRYSIRKLTIGAASVLIGIAFAGTVTAGTAKAATVSQAAASSTIEEKSSAVSSKESQAQTAKTDSATAADQKAEAKTNKQAADSSSNKSQAAQTTAEAEQGQSKASANSQTQEAKSVKEKVPSTADSLSTDKEAQAESDNKAAAATLSKDKAAQASQSAVKEAADQTQAKISESNKKNNANKADQTVLQKLAKDAKACDVKIKDEKLKSDAQSQERTITVHYIYGNGTGMDSSLAGQKVWDDTVLDVYYTNTGTAEHPVWKFDSSYSQNGYTNGYKIVKGSWASLPTDSSNDLFVSAPDITKNGSIYIPTINEDKYGNFIGNSSNEFVNPNYSGSAQDGSSVAYITDQENRPVSKTHTIYYEKKSNKAERLTIQYVDDDNLDSNGHSKLIYSESFVDGSGGYQPHYDGRLNTAFKNYADANHYASSNPGNYAFSKVTSNKADPGILRQDGNFLFTGANSAWSIPNYFWTVAQESSVNGATFTIHLKHKLNTVEKDITRTINITYPDRSPQKIPQKVVFTKQTDVVTGKDATNWQLQGSNKWAGLSFSSYENYSHTITITNGQGNVLKDSSDKPLQAVPEQKDITFDTPSQTLNVAIKNLQVDFTIKVIDEKTEQEIAYANITNASNNGWTRVTFTHGTSNQYYYDRVESSTGDSAIVKALRQDGDVAFNGPYSNWLYPNWSWNNTYHSDTAHLTQQQIYEMADSTFTIYVKHKTVNITLNNPKIDQTYTGKAQTIPDGIGFQAESDNRQVQPSSDPNNIRLTKDDFSFADEKGNVLTSAPTNAGTYYLILNDHGLNKFKACDSNFNWNYDRTYITYTISKANPKAVFSGNGSKPYNGSAIDSYTTPIGIAITAPGTVTTIDLTAGTDYVWIKDGQTYKTAPVDAGNYSIELTNAGKTKIKNVNADNLDWEDTDITGTGTYTIYQVAANVTMSGNQTETYNGSAKPLDLSKFVPTIKSGNLITPTIPAGTLTYDDYDVIDSEGNKVADNQLIKAGTYKVELNSNGLQKLKSLTGAGNFTWPASVDTFGQLIINPASKVIVHYYDDTNADNPTEIANQAKEFPNTDANPGSFSFNPKDFTKNWNYQQAGWSFEKQTPVSHYPTTGSKSPDGNYYVADYKVYLKVNSPLNENLTRHIAYVDEQGNALAAADQPAPSDQTLKISRTYSINGDGSVKLNAWTIDAGNAADFAREFDAPAVITDAAGNKYDLDLSSNHYSASAKLGDTDVSGVLTANNGKFTFAGNLGDLAKADTYSIILPYKMEKAAIIVHYIDVTGKTASSSGWQPNDGTQIKTASGSAAPNSTYAKPSWAYAANGWILVQDANWPAKFGLGGSKTDVYVYLKKKSTKPDNPDNPISPDNPVNPDQPVIPDNPIGPDNPINQEKQEDLVFITPTGRIVCRLANGISGLANHDLTQAQVINLINKNLPQGWQLPTGFVAKAIQVNGLSSFITVVPAKAQTTVYFVLGNGKVIKKTVWKINADGASQKQKIAFAKANLPAGYQLVEIRQSHSVEQGKEAIFITVAPKRAAAPKSKQNLVFVTQTGQRIKTISSHPAIAPKHIANQEMIQKFVPKGYQLAASHSINPVKMNNQEITVIVGPDKEQK